jgi:dihydroneopterin aldolase
MLKGHVEIEKLRIEASHGVLPQERLVGNTFEVSVGLFYDMEAAAVYDKIDYALDYSKLVTVVKDVMASPSDLLENVALRLKQQILATFPSTLGGKVRIAKLTPPIPAQLASVAISLEW